MTYPLHVLHTRSCAPGAVLEGGGRPVTINVPSRYILVLGVVLASVTIFPFRRVTVWNFFVCVLSVYF